MMKGFFIIAALMIVHTSPAQQPPGYFGTLITDTLFRSAHLGISVYEPATKRHILSYQSDKFFVPASNIKILTCYAALRYLPDTILLRAEEIPSNTMGPGWAWTDYEELENPFPQVPFLDTGIMWQGPVDSLLRPMMHRSDNFVAELLLRTVSRQHLGAVREEEMLDSLKANLFATASQQPNWVDGCGLSRYNLFTPLQFVHALDNMQARFGMERLRAIFPSGNEGTLKNYYLSEHGYIYAKTGSLTGVVALSGYLITRQKKTFIFSILVNNHNQRSAAIRRKLESFLRALRNTN